MSTNTTPKQPIMNKSSRGMSKNGYDTKLHGAFVEQSAGAGDNLPGLSCKQINQQIVAASQSTSAQPILTVIAQNLEHMNIVNLSTAAHRLARIASSSNGAQLAKVRQHPILAKLFQAIFEKFQDSVAAGSSQSQAMSNIAWSLATLNFTGNPALVHSLAQLTVDNLREFKPYELTTVTWAFAKLVSSAGQHELRWCPDHFFSVIAEYVLANIGEYCFRCLSTFAWAFATVRFRNAILFRTIAQQMPTVIGGEKTTSQQIADTVWAFATMRFHDSHLFTVLAEDALKHLRKFKLQEISDMLWAFAENNFWHEKLFLRAGEVAQHLVLPPQALAVILSSFARIQPQHPGMRRIVKALLPRCTKQILNFEPAELSLTALATAKIFGHQDMNTQPKEVMDFVAAATSSMALRVKSCSNQSLIDFVSALSMLRSGNDIDGCVQAIETEVMSRIHYLDHVMLIRFLRSLAVMRGKCSSSVAQLASKLFASFDKLNVQEMQVLSQVLIEILAMPNTGQHLTLKELRRHLVSLAPGIINGYMAPSGPSPDDTSEEFDSDSSDHTDKRVTTPRTASFSRGYTIRIKNSFLHIADDADNTSDVSTSVGSSSCSSQRSSSLPPMRLLSLEHECDRDFA
eukprot:gnl/TRDRNA2_/TRDRNA2_177555_c1_seq21.p1 gnl/TRDRNA2_/TRDRNA2_177555_c1~~gnl/TRDRNA2_/TRDRNA2_177555_c1_seq21.p1  ORF type:complete len:628 (+),score=128.09 gnl/TRDRNA2_/TRDRNA2_177555_c1_seq21:82-1965(+)